MAIGDVTTPIPLITKENEMHTQRAHGPKLKDDPIPVQVKLAAAWASFMFLYVYVDILGLYMPGVVEDILAGVVWEFQINEAWAVGALTLMAIPILMVVLSVLLPARANRATHLIVASLYAAVSVVNAIGESWTAYYAVAVGLEVAVLALILRFAWTWPRSTVATRAEVAASAATT